MAYSVSKGETLWAIATKLLGSGARWPELMVDGKPASEIDPTKLQIGANIQTAEEFDSGADVPAEEEAVATTPVATTPVVTEPVVEDQGIDVTVDSAPAAETVAEEGVGGVTPDTISIMTSPSMQWSFDSTNGTWHVSYALPNSDKRVFFEATGAQMDSIFGEGNRPTTYAEASFEEIAAGAVFSGDILEVSGTGSFESEVDRTIALALDEGSLPTWAQDDPAVMDLIYIQYTEGKSAEWLTEQISKLDSFKARYPGLEAMKKSGSLTTEEAVSGFLEMERGVKDIMLRRGMNPDDLSPAVVGDLIGMGHSLSDVAFVYESYERFNQNEAALNAFNEVLAERGIAPLGPDDQMAFLEGQAPAELYDIWEEASFAEAAAAAGLDTTVSEAMQLAGLTEGHTSFADATSALNSAAQSILRYRADIDYERYGLDQDDLIDMSLGITPRSGRSAADISQSMERALQSARAGIEGPRANRFRQFTQEGVPQAVSTSRSRAQE